MVAGLPQIYNNITTQYARSNSQDFRTYACLRIEEQYIIFKCPAFHLKKWLFVILRSDLMWQIPYSCCFSENALSVIRNSLGLGFSKKALPFWECSS